MNYYILTLRTDNPTAELGLFNKNQKVDYFKYRHFNQLSEDLLIKIEKLFNKNKLKFSDLSGIIVYKGPGSFTGLRIGISLANALSYSLNKPIIGSMTENWIKLGIKELLLGKNQKIVIPKYGALAHITEAKK
ncbi:MAG: tRNA (adenosine(37)-N6)-threonylcarbamoyltransferase complex dimerization subunit type 1 TsaB [Patescibacteria group bacterium]|jgi:Inactive homolog of metal-dependent proteases, putative molecular chaperone|nr:tRNA (adenosine(37)-N6)-threonylcarbamoyltransferase complex dimerization subunit type 1 TsaB [Patescibacteria group bacterium]